MNPGASRRTPAPFDLGTSSRAIWPSIIALLFAALSMISFAVDQSMLLSVPEAPGFNESR